jgi:hypothetical protein
VKPSERADLLCEDIAAFDNLQPSQQVRDQIVATLEAAERKAWDAARETVTLTWDKGVLMRVGKWNTIDDWRASRDD